MTPQERDRRGGVASGARRAEQMRRRLALLAALGNDPELARLSPNQLARFLVLRRSGQSRADALREALR